MQKITTFFMALILICSFLAGCGTRSDSSSPPPPSAPATVAVTPIPDLPPKKVGISLPDQTLRRWAQDGALMKRQLEDDGFVVDLRYADNDVETQVSQLEGMIAADPDVLVISAIDGSALTNVLTPAKEKGIPVIAYDRLIMESEAVSYYVSFDYTGIGVTHGKYIEEKLDLKNKLGPFNIELFAGSPDDSGPFSNFKWNGLLGFLQPYLGSGQVIIPSGQVDMTDIGIYGWKTETARERMENLIASQGYGPGGKRLDAVICASDSIALGVTQALLDAGYKEENFPVVTGWDCDLESVRNITRGTQSMSVFANALKLAERAMKMTESILRGGEPEINSSEEFDNGEFFVPTYVCDRDIVTRENYRELLVDSGYYTEAEIAGLESGG